MKDLPEYNIYLKDILESLAHIITPLKTDKIQEIDTSSIYWSIGFQIKTHLDNHHDKDKYKAYLFSTLPEKLEVSRGLLYKCYNFYKAFPHFTPSASTLSWSHYRALLSVKSADERAALEKTAAENRLQVTDLLAIIRQKDNSLFSLHQIKLPEGEHFPVIGRVRYSGGTPYLDLGFYTYTDLIAQTPLPFREDDLVHITKEDNQYRFQPYTGDTIFRYIYRAKLHRVIDGDTLSLIIDLGFHCNTRQRLRLRGIDAPALKSKRGLEAKKYIDRVLDRPGISLAIQTARRDRYARFISDIYYMQAARDPIRIINDGHYLNKELLEKGLADPYLGG